MSFHFHDQPFWGRLVIAPDHDIVVQPIGHAHFRPRLIARWIRAADGRLERRWHHAPAGHLSD